MELNIYNWKIYVFKINLITFQYLILKLALSTQKGIQCFFQLKDSKEEKILEKKKVEF